MTILIVEREEVVILFLLLLVSAIALLERKDPNARNVSDSILLPLHSLLYSDYSNEVTAFDDSLYQMKEAGPNKIYWRIIKVIRPFHGYGPIPLPFSTSSSLDLFSVQ